MKSPSKAKTTAVTASKGSMVLIVTVVAMIAAVIVVYGYLAIKDNHDKEYIKLLGEQRVLSQRLTKYANQAMRANDLSVFRKMREAYKEFEHNFDLLKDGDPATGMPPSPAEVMTEVITVEKLWENFDTNILTIVEHEKSIVSIRKTVQAINDRSAQLLASSDEVATLMANRGAPKDQVYVASKQLMLIQRMINNANRILEGGEDSVTSADRFGRDAALFGRVVKGLLRGNRGMGIQRVTNSKVRAKLVEVDRLFTDINKNVNVVLKRTPEIFKVSEAAHASVSESDDLLQRITELYTAYLKHMGSRKIDSTLGSGLGAFTLILLLIMIMQLRQDGMRRLKHAETDRLESEERNRRNQQAIMRLLDEMGDLADGDLTVNATVTEDVTGAIADSINYAIEALRTLVAAINDTATHVTQAAQQSEGVATQLSLSSEKQAAELGNVTAAVTDMAQSIEAVSANADLLADEAGRSVQIAKTGSQAVQKTIEGMNTIREQIQETSKRIKRLGESSQEIGDIVELINDIAEQTNILALNAAIQAAMAGEAGRGFAVVADEVQRLAERSADATKQIEGLVKTIQTDTNEAVTSMEQTTSQVVGGARLAEDAGSALGTIDRVATHLADLVGTISEATHQQAGAASNVSDTMHVIQEITSQTLAGTTQTASAIANLADQANSLKKSVSGFKLPD